MAMRTEVFVNHKRRVGRMADRDAACLVEDDDVVRGRGVDCRGQFILMTVYAVDCWGLAGVFDDHLHGGASRNSPGIDVTGCVVTGPAVIAMGGHDVGPVQRRVAVGAGFVIDHTLVGGGVELYLVGGVTAAMGMAGKGAGVAVLALAAAVGSGTDADGCGGGVTGHAAIDFMNLAGRAEGRGGGIGVAAQAVLGGSGGACLKGIDLDRGIVAVGVSVKVGAMALDAGAAFAEVDGGIATAVDPDSAVAVDWIMAGGARGVDSGDDVAGMATDAKRRCCHRGVMAVGVAVEVEGMAADAVLAALN